MVKLVMVGKCESCGTVHTSRYPFQLAECHCQNTPVNVPLKLTILPAKRHVKKLEEIAGFRHTSVKKLVGELLEIWL